MEKSQELINDRDINLICQYYNTFAQIEGMARRRNIMRARRRSGIWKSERQFMTNGISLL